MEVLVALPHTITGESITDTEPKTLEVKNTDIQGIYGLEPGDVDPDFETPALHHHAQLLIGRGFRALGAPPNE
jgi:hypothetical protein